jgi:N-acetyl-anhydromuramyl-L-alanine amidase AmpD
MTDFKMKYEIIPRYLAGPSMRRPTTPLAGVRFICGHDTGNSGSTAANNVAYYERSRNDDYASAHIFVDDTEIIECIPFLTGPPEIAFHVVYNTPIDNALFGVDTNDYAGGVELCYGGDIDNEEAYLRYVWVMAYACWRYGLDPLTDISAHYILDPKRKIDPKSAFKLVNKTFDEFLADVKREYDECTTERTDVMLRADVAITVINTWMVPSYNDAISAKEEAEKAGETDVAEAYQAQADYYHWLADQLRTAAGITEETE